MKIGSFCFTSRLLKAGQVTLLNHRYTCTWKDPSALKSSLYSKKTSYVRLELLNSQCAAWTLHLLFDFNAGLVKYNEAKSPRRQKTLWRSLTCAGMPVSDTWHIRIPCRDTSWPFPSCTWQRQISTDASSHTAWQPKHGLTGPSRPGDLAGSR